ncbi:sialate O-acetylesterase [Aquimarina sp. ERC-38]|uniref:sialate O-acetylesterase n=1 Tax=Aquimarina sp. ERC-38 TaxID=2949996 RepID=UPI0022453AF6|nr:sialate O-acetylesterase [Aquimarina sp. ERC-38]UZO82235.1 sialate O-acetylesterase [Aquimarina sp. ERC-38]
MIEKGILICLTFFVTSLYAEVIPNGLFKSNMVLQRNKPIAIFGKATTEKVVEITFKGKTYKAKVKRGTWNIFLEEAKAGGPFRLTIKGENKIDLLNVMVGEVWVCSGQSNMEMPVKGFEGQHVNGSNLAILNSKNNQLRFFNVGRKIADAPSDTISGQWQLSKPETVKNFSATAYFYGKLLQEKLKVPVGLILSSWGGTPAEAWTPKSSIDAEFAGFDKWNTDDKKPQKNPSVLYNGMIHPLIPFTIKGVIWYQGESNKSYHHNYTELFTALIKSWRVAWNQGDFPFYFVQIAPVGWGGDAQAFLREKQLRTMMNVENTGMVVTLDIGDKYCIHPPEKRKVGERLALWALAKDYGYDGIEFSGPIYKSMEVKSNKVLLHFDYAPNGVTTMGKELTGFEVAGEDRIFYTATTKITKGSLEVWSDRVAKPVAVRYGWSQYIDGALYNTAGLPASSFRTDNWD